MSTNPSNKEQREPIRTPCRIIIAGVGGAGLHAVEHLLQAGYDGPEYMVIDTDGEALNASPVPSSVQIGANLTRGLGTGGVADLGRRSANGDHVKLRELFRNTELLFLVAGLGGGTGAGATPVIAQTARQEGALVIGCGIWPFEMEGAERRATAEAGLKQLRRSCNTVIVLPNQDLLKTPTAEMNVQGAFAAVDRHFGGGLRVIWTLLGQQNLLDVDFIGLTNLLEGQGGLCTFIHTEGAGKNKARLALDRALAHPALAERGEDAQPVQSLLVGVLGGEDLTMSEAHYVVQGLAQNTPTAARRRTGVGIDPSMNNRLSVVVLLGDESDRGDVPVSGTTVTGEGKRDATQADLPYVTVSKGRFKDVEPTIYGGQDLDIPTFIRRGMKLTRPSG